MKAPCKAEEKGTMAEQKDVDEEEEDGDVE